MLSSVATDRTASYSCLFVPRDLKVADLQAQNAAQRAALWDEDLLPACFENWVICIMHVSKVGLNARTDVTIDETWNRGQTIYKKKKEIFFPTNFSVRDRFQLCWTLGSVRGRARAQLTGKVGSDYLCFVPSLSLCVSLAFSVWWRYSTTFALTPMRRAPPPSHMIPAGTNARTHAPTPAARTKRVHLVIKKNWILICPQPGQFLTNFKKLKFHIFIEIYIFFSFLWCVDIVSISNATTVISSVGF